MTRDLEAVKYGFTADGDLSILNEESHLFLAKNPQGKDVLWWGTGPDDNHCEELDLSSLRRGSAAGRKAVWEAVMGSYMVEDCTDWVAPDA